MIVSGRIEIFKDNKTAKLPLTVMKNGQIFGMARLTIEGATRTACAVTLSDSILLTIERGSSFIKWFPLTHL